MEVNRKPSDVALAAPASSNSLFKGDRQRNLRQAGGKAHLQSKKEVQGAAWEVLTFCIISTKT